MVKLAEYSHDFKVKRKEEVFDGIIRWLSTEGAEIENSNKPLQITAMHGSRKTVSVWKRNARKKLDFSLTDTAEGTHVQVEAHTGSMMYLDDVATWKKQIYVNYGLLLEEIWASVDGVPFTYPGEETTTQPPETEKKSKWKLFK